MYRLTKLRNVACTRNVLTNSNSRNPMLAKHATASVNYSSIKNPHEIKICQNYNVFPRKYFQQPFRKYSTNNNNKGDQDYDDLQAILKDKSIGIVGKFKILFKQYGLVVVVVHCITAAVWIAIFYAAVVNGIDIIPLLEKYGILNAIEKIPGMPSAEKIKGSGAKDWLLVYLLYEIFKPIRYIVTVFGTVFAIRYLRRMGYMKPPPKIEPQVRDMVSAQSNIMKFKMNKTANKYRNNSRSRINNMREKYKNRLPLRRRKKNGKNSKTGKNS